MTYAICVKDDYVGIMGRHVTEGQAVVPGLPLIDIMKPDGLVETIVSEGWGIVAHIEGGRVFQTANSNDRAEDDDEDDDDSGESGQARGSSGGMGTVFSRGDLICHIVSRLQDGGRKSGLHPRNGASVCFRREMGLAPR